MVDIDAIGGQFNKIGYVVLRQFFDAERISILREICDRVHRQWLAQKPIKRRNKKNLACLTEPTFHAGHFAHLKLLLETIADDRVLFLLEAISDRCQIFNDAQYFFNPETKSWQGEWHRDGQHIAPNDRIEWERISNSSFVRIHVAFLPDDCLEFVPYSHARWDTSTELSIRKGLNGIPTNSNAMPLAHRVSLEPGDAVVFDGYGIHRGRYFASVPRGTLALLYGSPVDWHTPPVTCFRDSDVLKGLSPQKQSFFDKFILLNQGKWAKDSLP